MSEKSLAYRAALWCGVMSKPRSSVLFHDGAAPGVLLVLKGRTRGKRLIYAYTKTAWGGYNGTVIKLTDRQWEALKAALDGVEG